MMVRNIASHSAPKIHYLKHLRAGDVLTDYEFAATGSSALIKLLETIGLSLGDTVLVPSYICDSVTLALDYAGYKTMFVEPDGNQLWPSEYSLEHITTDKKIDAVIFIEYFGFEIRRFNQLFNVFENKNIPIIIDRCHAGLIEAEYDSRIQNKIFSFSKSFPIFPVGAYKTECKENSFNLIPNKQFKTTFLLFFIKNIFISSLFCIKSLPLSLFTIKDYNKKIFPERITKKERISLRSPSISGAAVKTFTDTKLIQNCRRRRRACYRILARSAEKMGLDVLKLSANDVPQSFVIRDNCPYLIKSLRSQGIGAYRWPDQNIPEVIRSDPELYPNANRLCQSLICIPLHEDLKLPDLNWLLEVLNALKGNSK